MWRGLLCGTLLVGAIVGMGAANAPHGEEFGPFGGPHHPPGPLGRLFMGKMGRLMVLRSEMNLTEDQHGQLKKIMLENRKDVGPHLGKIAMSLRGLRDAVLADEPNEANIRKAAEVHANAVADAAVTISKVAQQGKKVLTEEQKGLVKKFFADNDAAMDKFMAEAKSKLEQNK